MSAVPPGWTIEQARERLEDVAADVQERPYSHPVTAGWYAEDIAALLALLGEAREALERVRNDWSFLFNLHENVTLDPRVRRALADYNLKTLDALLSRLAAPEDGA